jgi:hypothetical protein
MLTESLRPVDLAFLAAKKRQSPRTGFVHFFYGHDAASDTIPFYENVCYAVALLQQRKAEAVLEAKDLLCRLLSFQTAEGNFPVYLHDYPRCFSFLMGLKVAPLLLLIIRSEASIPSVGAECREKTWQALQRILAFYADQKRSRTLPPLWEYRYQMCKAISEGSELPLGILDTTSFSSADWWEYWVTKQFQEVPSCHFYHAELGLCLGPFIYERAQEGFQPAPALIDWVCAETIDTPRLMTDHPSQMGLAALEAVRVAPQKTSAFALLSDADTGNWDLFWKDKTIHRLSLDLPLGKMIQKEMDLLYIELPSVFDRQREDLFEVAFYIDASPEIDVSIGGVKGTSFGLGDWVQIRSETVNGFSFSRFSGSFEPLFDSFLGGNITLPYITPQKRIENRPKEPRKSTKPESVNSLLEKSSIAIRFTVADGEGDFCGHIYRSNRPNQRLNTEGESFDWKIGLRTLRRSAKCCLSVQVVRVCS